MADIRYELFGWDFTAINPLDEQEVRWHLHWAEKIGGPILGLACGSGRLLAKLAKAGYEVTGMDISETMLAIAREYREQLAETVRHRMELIHGDMTCFNLDRQFGLIMIADNSFRELPTREQLYRCLRTIRRHLRPGGRLLIVERRFRPELYTDYIRQSDWTKPMRHPDTGEWVRRRVRVRLHKNQRRLFGCFEYEVTDDQGDKHTIRCPWSGPILELEEYRSLFHRAGFETQVFTDYGFKPNEQDGKLWCFVCSPC